jgi:hypothetical protein
MAIDDLMSDASSPQEQTMCDAQDELELARLAL